MYVASLELSKTLFDLSGWNDTDCGWLAFSDWDTGKWTHEISKKDKKRWVAGAYDLGYLLRKLPDWAGHRLTMEKHSFGQHGGSDEYHFGYGLSLGNMVIYAATPEDSACKLAIELFNQGILKREDSHDEK